MRTVRIYMFFNILLGTCIVRSYESKKLFIQHRVHWKKFFFFLHIQEYLTSLAYFELYFVNREKNYIYLF